jgi:hypothetical protein
MLTCFLSAAIGFALLGGSFATASVSEKQHDVLRRVLSPELDLIYNKIANERRNLYIQGILIGVVLSAILLYHANIKNKYFKVSAFFAITLTVTVFYYLLMPKSDYMLNHLKTSTENKAWLYVYNTMKTRYLIGMLLGAVASLAFSFTLC